MLAALLLTGAGVLRAEPPVLNAVGVAGVPDGSNYILGVEIRGISVLLITTNEVYSAARVQTGWSLFTKILDASAFIEGITEESTVAVNPTDLSTITYTSYVGFVSAISTVQVEAPFERHTNPSTTEETFGKIKYGSDGSLYFFTPETGFQKYASGPEFSSAPVMTFGTSGPGQITSMTNGLTVSGNTLYAYDPDESRVVMFNTETGNYLSDFAVTGGHEGSAIAVSLDGRLFLTHGDGTVGVYSLATGETIYSLTYFVDWFHAKGVGVDSLAFDDNKNQLYFFDTNLQGVHEYHLPAYTPVPEPSAYSLIVAGLVGGMVLVRRRRNFVRK